MTSNIASEYLLNTEHEMIDDEVIQKELQRHFRPELLNRIDSIITFNSLSKEVIMEIIDRQLTLLQIQINVRARLSNQIYRSKYQKNCG
jgi:ATP-dependent Clp protease ATP-binding subunit ClpB